MRGPTLFIEMRIENILISSFDVMLNIIHFCDQIRMYS